MFYQTKTITIKLDFIKHRYIGQTVRLIFDIMDFTVEENIPGLLIFIDFQKAFDTLEGNVLRTC